MDGRSWSRSFGRRHTVARSNGRRKTPRHRPSVLHLAACAVGLASRAAAAIPALRHHAVQGRWCDSQSRCFCVAECGCLTVCACVRCRSKLPTHPGRPPLCFRHAICRGCGVRSVALRCSWARVLMYGVTLQALPVPHRYAAHVQGRGHRRCAAGGGRTGCCCGR